MRRIGNRSLVQDVVSDEQPTFPYPRNCDLECARVVRLVDVAKDDVVKILRLLGEDLDRVPRAYLDPIGYADFLEIAARFRGILRIPVRVSDTALRPDCSGPPNRRVPDSRPHLEYSLRP